MEHAVEERMEWVRAQAQEIEQERGRLEGVRIELERKMSAFEAGERKGKLRSC